jgi:hypothetical protein
LVQHATAVDGVAEQAGTAAQAAQTVQLDNQAYGMLCQIIPALLNPLSAAVVQALDLTEEGLHDTADRLREASGTYSGTDRAVAGDIDALRPQ